MSLICPLCKESVSNFKSNSHIIPKWMYIESGIFDEKKRTIHIDTNETKRSVRQDGLKGSFFCNNCEEKTAALDSYASHLFKKTVNSHSPFKKEELKTNEFLVQKWSGFDFKKIQNFIYSICLRQHFDNISKNKEGLITSDKHLSNLLNLYQSDSLIDYLSYPIIICSYKRSKFSNLNFTPYVKKFNGHRAILFMTCEFHFYIKISSHKAELFNDEIVLQPPGQIYIIQLQLQFEDTKLGQSHLSNLKKCLQQIKKK